MNGVNVHELKILPDYFDLQVDGKKRFEVRHNDRNFKVDDVLILNEFDGEKYTGRCITVTVTSLLDAENFYGIIDQNFVILGTSEALEVVL
ncbi:DUF3850 domain-containing protein [Vibrio harveyi]|uniref:DUF3850 domain-containing protein n=1 Tax=Vibrio harveyi TaxID=669 RepID=UPI003BB64416